MVNLEACPFRAVPPMPSTFVGLVASAVNLRIQLPGLFVRFCYRIVVIPEYWCRVDTCSGGSCVRLLPSVAGHHRWVPKWGLICLHRRDNARWGEACTR